MKETSSKIRAELKERGVPRSSYSIRASWNMDASIRITVKDLSIPLQVFREVAEKYEEIHRCEASYEILSGGNTFVFVEYDWEVRAAARDLHMVEAEAVYKNGYKVLRRNEAGDRLVYFHSDGDNYGILEVIPKDSHCSLENHRVIYSPYDIANGIASFTARGTLY